MTAYYENKKIKSFGEHGIYIGSPNSNCITYTPEHVLFKNDPINIKFVGGNLTLSTGGILSGFTSAIYGEFPNNFNPGNNSFEIFLKFTTGTITSSQEQDLFSTTQGTTNATRYGTRISIQSSKLVFDSGGSSNSWVNLATDYTMSQNTMYYLKVVYNKTNYAVSISTDNIAWQNFVLDSSIAPLTAAKTYLGTWTQYNNNWFPFLGSFDLPQCYIKINNVEWWRGGKGQLTLKSGSKLFYPNGFTDYDYYKYVLQDYTVPKMTSLTAPEGSVTASYSKTTYSNDPWVLWWNAADFHYDTHNFNGKTITNQYNFKNTVKGGTYTLSFVLYRQSSANAKDRKFIIISETGAEYVVWSLAANASTTKTTYTQQFTVPNFVAIRYEVTGASGSTTYICEYVNELNLTPLKLITNTTTGTASDYDYKIGKGQKKFTEKTLTKDITLTSTDVLARPIYVDQNDVLRFYVNSTSGTATTKVTENEVVYRTDLNTIEAYHNGKLAYENLSLPIAFGNPTTGITPYNWCGCLGSTAFMLPGVKAFIPNGKDENRLYKSIEYINDRVQLATRTWADAGNPLQFICLRNDGDIWYYTRYGEGDSLPSNPLNYTVFWNKKTNEVYYKGGSTETNFIKVPWIKAFGTDGTETTSAVTAVTPVQVKPTTTVLPINKIYRNSQLLYQYLPYAINVDIYKLANPSTTTTSPIFEIPQKGNYKVWLVGGGNTSTSCYQGCWYAGCAAVHIGELTFNAACRVRFITGGSKDSTKLQIATANSDEFSDLIICTNAPNTSLYGGGGGTLTKNTNSLVTYGTAELSENGKGANNTGYRASLWGGYGASSTNGYSQFRFLGI